MSALGDAEALIAALITRTETVAIAESLTGGGLGHALTTVPGASKVFSGGLISYTNRAKIDVLGVDPNLLDRFAAVSKEVAEAMADCAREKFGTTWGVSTTGIAGPGDFEGIGEGTVWISIRGPINESFRLQLDGGREAVRAGAISSAIATFARILSHQDI